MQFMGFMEKIMQRAKSTKEVVVRKSSDVAKMTKLKMNIMSTESKIKEAYNEIGRLVYDAFRADEGDSDAVEAKCAELDALYAELEEIKGSYAKVRNMKRCPNCQTDNLAEAQFCSKCGNTLAEVVDSMPKDGETDTIIEVETAE